MKSANQHYYLGISVSIMCFALTTCTVKALNISERGSVTLYYIMVCPVTKGKLIPVFTYTGH